MRKRTRLANDQAVLDLILASLRSGQPIYAETIAAYNQMADRVYQPAPAALASVESELAELRRRVGQLEGKRSILRQELPERLPLA
ncbi:MAG: hypothetical protein ACRDV9_05995 [Acidimicrobiia bacterium]